MPLIAVHWRIALDVSSAVVGDDQRRLVVLGPGADRATRTIMSIVARKVLNQRSVHQHQFTTRISLTSPLWGYLFSNAVAGHRLGSVRHGPRLPQRLDSAPAAFHVAGYVQVAFAYPSASQKALQLGCHAYKEPAYFSATSRRPMRRQPSSWRRKSSC
jgi:hypothetical protein